ncbi:MAG: glycosyltransferase family 39 protein [Desulforhabdus sp.]|jgi:4-amino-4-deoxy-L-arabinose transferase-like glycosyltransferase|nr:glycosyltransferase family 39 protein [Desulforhabdus sp.]
MTEAWKNDDERLYKTLLQITFVGSILIFFWGIWSIPTLSHNEARRMIVVQEMLANRDWLIPTLNQNIYLEKPPLFYWLALTFSLLFNSTAEWVVRLPSALSAFGLTWLLFDRVKKYIGRWEALFAALTLVTSVQFTMFARRAEIEMVLTACCATSLIFYFDYLKERDGSKYLYLSYLFLGLACLTKGPVALVFFVPPILVFGLVKKDRRALWGLLSLRGWAIFSIIAFPWFIYTYLNLEKRVERVIDKDLTYKIFHQENGDPFYKYLLVLLGALVPWILIIFYQTKRIVRSVFADSTQAYFAYGFLVPLVIMSLFATKHGKYILPLIPCLAVLLGIWLAELAGELGTRWPERFHSRSVVIAGIMVFCFFLYYAAIEANIYKYRYEAFRPLIEKVNASSKGNPVYLYKDLTYRVVYYYGKPMPVLEKADVRQKIDQGESFLLIADSRSWNDLQNEKLCVMAEFKPFIKKDRAVRILASHSLCQPS